MKTIRQLSILALLGFASSCAFFNDRTVDLSIKSSPAGADIFIEGKSYGQTPAVIKIEPKRYEVVLNKEGYGSTSFVTEFWYGTVRTDIHGARTGDGTRCFLDTMSLVFSFNMWNSTRCGDFKQKEYNVIIPRLNKNSSAAHGGNSMLGVGQRPHEMIDYYYNQDMKQYAPGSMRDN